MKKTKAGQQQEPENTIQQPRKAAARPLLPTNKILPRFTASHQQQQADKGSHPPRLLRKHACAADKENIPKATPQVTDRKPALSKRFESKSTAPLTTRAASRLTKQAAPTATPSQSAQIRKPALTGGGKLFMQDDYDDLTIQFETLKRQSLRPSISGSAIRQPQLKPKNSPGPSARAVRSRAGEAGPRLSAPAPGSKSITDLAEELFDEPAFLELCGKAMNTNLQRTRDGATAESRVQELAGAIIA